MIYITIDLAAFFSPDESNADFKILNQQLFEEFWWYYTGGALGSYPISPISFAFPIGITNVG